MTVGRWTLWLVAAWVLLFAASSAQSQEFICGEYEEIARVLAEQYGEQRRFVGIDATGNLLEMYVAPGGSFTAVLTQPGGPSCLVATGEAGNILPAGDMG